MDKDDFEELHDNYLFFLKESILNGDYTINPKAIAAQWMLDTVAKHPIEECSVE
jgi:hypothetical protein